MANIETWFDQDLTKPVQVKNLGNIFNQDSLGNLIGVRVKKNGDDFTLSGSVNGYCILADGSTVPVIGTRSGNTASIILPASAYSVTGPIAIAIKLTDGNAITTLAACVGIVTRSRTGEQIDPGQTVNDWTNQIAAALQDVEDASSAQDVKIDDLKSALTSYEGGTTGQLLRKKSNADYDVEWSNYGAPTDEQVVPAVENWLDDHPEATTTVEDGSLTEAKFAASALVNLKNYVVTPQMYGAAGNGVQDDTEYIQAALNAKKKVYFPQGIYKITEPLVIANGQMIEGDSKYFTVINAVGCDCIHIKDDDQGERGTIQNIHFSGNYTADSKGIRLSALAPGWTFENVWISGFDYGIYGYRVGHVNNIYVIACIITGNQSSGHHQDMHGGIYMPNSEYQINAVTIRDTEINFFDAGITIGGTAISIVQNTIQGCNNCVVSDAGIGRETNTNYTNTYGMMISGNYMELLVQSAIYLSTANHDSSVTRSAGFFEGVQIMNNYIYKNNAGSADYAIIRFKKSPTYGTANIWQSSGLEYSSVFIAGNSLKSTSNSFAMYDIANCLGKDSIVMHAMSGGKASYTYGIELDTTGANFYSNGLFKKEITTWFSYPCYKNSNVEFTDEKTAVLHPNGLLKMYISRNDLSEYEYLIKAASTYPFKCAMYLARRDAGNGRLYEAWNANGFRRELDCEDKNWEAVTSGTSIAESQLSEDGYYHKKDNISGGGAGPVTIHSIGGYCFVIKSCETTQDLIVKAPTLTFHLVT